MPHQYFAICDFEIDGSSEGNAALSAMCIDQALASSVTHLNDTAPMVLETDDNGLWIGLSMGQGEEACSVSLAELPNLPPIENWMRGAGGLESTYFDRHMGKVKLPVFKANKQFELQADPDGKSRLGGNVPDGFSPATTGKPNDTQYIGTLSPKDFPTLPFHLHLSVPIFDEFSTLFLDYSDPMAPLIANPPQIEEEYIQSVNGVVEGARQACWENIPFCLVPTPRWLDEPDLGVAGVPAFTQGPDIPKSPKTGKLMQFLCQFSSLQAPKLVRSSIGQVEYEDYFKDDMSFFGDGSVFLFWEAETKLMAFVMQNT